MSPPRIGVWRARLPIARPSDRSTLTSSPLRAGPVFCRRMAAAMRLIDGDVDRRGLRAVHARERHQVAAIVHDGDIHGHADASGLGLGRCQYGLGAFEREFRMIERYVSHFCPPM